MRKLLSYFIICLLAAFLIIQFVPVKMNNPDVTYDIPTTPAVKSVLRRACYECHSNQTMWPWYSKIAPVSWMISSDIIKGRKALNYSEWDRYTNSEKIKQIRESWEEVSEGEMPPYIYIKMHPESKLTVRDRNLLHEWAARTYPSGVIPSE